jgi:hypothetical protein
MRTIRYHISHPFPFEKHLFAGFAFDKVNDHPALSPLAWRKRAFEMEIVNVIV